MASIPQVTILVPALNEEAYVARAVTSLTSHTEDLDYELIVLDGGSSDRTREIVASLSLTNPRIRLVPNEGRIQSVAVNKGAKIARSGATVFVRADCHAVYPKGFVAGLVKELQSREAASVVVPMLTAGETFLQRAIAAAQNSRLGNGAAAHRCGGRSRYIEHGHHAAFDRKVFLSLGGYDETFTHNEDAELDLRLAKSGAKIWLCSELAITYFPRKSLTALARQYFSFGCGRARTVRKHRAFPKLRQMIPIGILGLNVASIALGMLAGWLWLTPFAGYVLGCFLWGQTLAIRRRDRSCLLSGVVVAIIHHSWALGFMLELLLGKEPTQSAFQGGHAPTLLEPRVSTEDV